jgi:hypothetical protein
LIVCCFCLVDASLLLVALCCVAKLEEKEKRHPSLPLVETRWDYAVVLEQLPNPKRPSSMARYRRERQEPKTVSAVLRRAKKKRRTTKREETRSNSLLGRAVVELR